MKKNGIEYIRLIKRKPNLCWFFMDYLRQYDLDEEEQLELVNFFEKDYRTAKDLLSVYSEHHNLCDKALLRLIELMKNKILCVTNFWEEYNRNRQHKLGPETQLKLIELWLSPEDYSGYLRDCNFCDFDADVQMKVIDLLPNEKALWILLSQHSYSKDILLRLTDLWEQYPNEVSRIFNRRFCEQGIFQNKDVFLKVLNFIESKPQDIRNIMQSYLRYDDIGSVVYPEIPIKLVEYMEKSSESTSSLAKELMILYTKRLCLFDKELCKKIMKLFRAKPNDMYDIILSAGQHMHSEIIDDELIKSWQKGSQEAYDLLLKSKNISNTGNAKIVKLWLQGKPGAYELLKAQGRDIMLGEQEQVKLVSFLKTDSKEAYDLLKAYLFYPGHRLCPKAMIKLLSIESRTAAGIYLKVDDNIRRQTNVYDIFSSIIFNI